jgi:hypothetical protein
MGRLPVRIVLVVTVTTLMLAGWGKVPPAQPVTQTFASPAVFQELRDTRPAFAALTIDQQSFVHLWLLANCAVGADRRSDRLKKLGGGVEPALIEAFRMGPPSALLGELADSRRDDLVAIKADLADDDSGLFKPELRSRVAALSEDSYVDEAIGGTIAGYRIAALDGLALIGSETALRWLAHAEPTIQDPAVKRAAARTLTALRKRKQ